MRTMGVGTAMVVAVAAGAAQGQVVNGGFEEPALGFRTVQPGQTYGSWTAGGPSDIEFVRAEPSAQLPGLQFSAFEGEYWIDLVGVGAPSALFQDIVTQPGASYDVGFALAGNPFGPGMVMTMDVLWNGAVVGSYSHDTTGRSFMDMGWTLRDARVLGTGLDRLTFRATSGGAARGPAIDAVTLTIVPTPGTAAAAALLGLTLARRRR